VQETSLPLASLRRLWSATPLFLFTCESLAIIFYSEHVETEEITVKLLKITKHTFRNATYRKAIKFRFTMQLSIILMESKMAEADKGSLFKRSANRA